MGVSPTSPQLLIGRVPHVTDETSEQDFDRDLADLGLDDELDDDPDDVDDEFDDDLDALDDDTLDAVEEAQRAMALYELAAIHLSANPPDLIQAALAIDAVACLVDGLGDRLGDEAPTMRDALNNIRLAFVQIKGATAEAAD